MHIIGYSLLRLTRTPIRTMALILLIALATALLALGVNLERVSLRNIQSSEESFHTIATVEQVPNSAREVSLWYEERYFLLNRPVFDRIIPVAELYFEGANYVHAPQRMPIYGAYSPSYQTQGEYEGTKMSLLIAQLTPLTDCVPDDPVAMRIDRVFYGQKQEGDIISFCDIYRESPPPLLASESYIMALQFMPVRDGSGYQQAYVAAKDISSSQYDENGARIADPDGAPSETWERVTPGYYDTARGRRWQELAKAVSRLDQTIPVLPTNATHLLMNFYEGTAAITLGRDILEEEYENGDRVCLIQRSFARDNGLAPGDTIGLPLYYADYRALQDSASPNWAFIDLLNAQGKAYAVFDDEQYTVVGVYDVLSPPLASPDFVFGEHMVVIPAASVKQSDARNIAGWGPMMAYNTAFEIPNGQIEQYVQAWHSQGVEGLDITFYDKGYGQLMEGYLRLRVAGWVLLALGVSTCLLTLAIFCRLVVDGQWRSIAIERSLGLGKGQCMLSLLSGMMIVVTVGAGFGATAGYLLYAPLTQVAMNDQISQQFDLAYSAWAPGASTYALAASGLQQEGRGLYLLVAVSVVMAAFVFALVEGKNIVKGEPLSLFARKRM